ncbi:MAG: alpha-L-arabinofuranosidase C-terminal domain-containing protein, partial [Pedobacter agri]
LTPTYHIFDLFKVHMDAKYLPINFTSPDYVYGDKKIAALNVSASQDSTGAVHISLVNLDPKNNISLNADLGELKWKTVTGQILTSGKLTDINTFTDGNKIHNAKFTGAKKAGSALKVQIPAQSVVVLELK